MNPLYSTKFVTHKELILGKLCDILPSMNQLLILLIVVGISLLFMVDFKSKDSNYVNVEPDLGQCIQQEYNPKELIVNQDSVYSLYR